MNADDHKSAVAAVVALGVLLVVGAFLTSVGQSLPDEALGNLLYLSGVAVLVIAATYLVALVLIRR